MMKFIPSSPPFKKSGTSGNVFFMLFGAVALVGAIGAGTMTHMKGIVTSMSEVTRKSVAEEKMMGGARLSVMAATDLQANQGDCDNDGLVEPLPFVNAGTAPKPTGGGWLPADIGAEAVDPWGQKYGYCVWDPGSQFDVAGCGGPGARRLKGSLDSKDTVIAVISPGKNRKFETTCSAYVNASTPMITRGANFDDIILEYTYEDASGLSGEDLWKIRDTDPTTATIDKNIEVSGSGTFDGTLNLMKQGLILPSDPGDNTVTGSCDSAAVDQLRVNAGESPPALEICYSGEWTPVSMAGGSGTQFATPTQAGKVKAGDAGANEWFGFDVAADGNTMIVGAVYDGQAGAQAGAAYIFTKANGKWTQTQKLVGSDTAAGDRFGYTVDIEGGTAIVSAPSNNGLRGAVYVFTRSGTTWTQTQKIVPADVAANDYAGIGLDMSGNTILIGSDGGTNNNGAVYVYQKSATWTQTQKLTASDSTAQNFFGVSVAISGNRAVIGATRAASGGTDRGAAYIFEKSGTWLENQKITAADAVNGDYFGRSVAIDGDTVVVGSRGGAASNGAAYVFGKTTTWAMTQKLTASDAAAGDDFGYSVGIQGNLILSAAAYDDGPTDSGSVYVFKRSATWTQAQKLVPDDPAASKLFGHNVFIKGDSAYIGAVGDAETATASGSAYVFEGMCYGETCGMGTTYQSVVPTPLTPPNFPACTSSGQGPFKVKATNTTPGIIQRVYNNGAYIFATDTNNNLRAVKISNGDFVNVGSAIANGTAPKSLFATSTHIFVGSDTTLRAYTFNGTSFTAAGSIPLPASAYHIYSADGYVFAAMPSDKLIAYQYNGTNFTQAGEFDSPGSPYDVWGDGNHIYLTDMTSGLHILSFDGTAFKEVANVMPGGSANSSWADGRFIYVATSTGIYAYKFENNALTLLGSYTGGGDAREIWSNGPVLMVGYDNSGDLRALTFNGNSFTQLGVHAGPGAGVNLPSITGDGTNIYAAYSGSRNLTALSGFGCGESMAPSAAVVTGVNRYNGKIAMNAGSGCGIKSDSSAWCWGQDATYFALGNGPSITANQTQPSPVDSSETSNSYVAVNGGAYSMCGLKQDGTAWCWGSDASGILGNGATLTANQSSPSPVAGGHLWSQISMGATHACGIKNDGTAWCWGDDAYGQLGNGATGASAEPSAVEDTARWIRIGAANGHTCGIKIDGSAWCWGLGNNGQRGGGATALASQIPVAVVEPGPWVQISPGAAFTCGVKSDASAWCWGSSANGALGNNGAVNTSVPVRISDPGPWIQVASATSMASACGIKMDGTAWCWGRNDDGQVGAGSTGGNQSVPRMVTDPGPWAEIVPGYTRTCGIKIDGSAWCWGADTVGALGNGSITGTLNTPSRVYNFSHLNPWQWDNTGTKLVKAVTSAGVVIPSTSSIGFDGTDGGFSFPGGTQSMLRNANGNVRLTVESVTGGSNAQISLRAASVIPRSIGIDGTTGSLELGMNNAAMSTWMNAITPLMQIAPNGYVGTGATTPVAALDITNGGVRIGNDTRLCTPSRAGTLIFVSDSIRYCDGEDWKMFSQAPPPDGCILPWGDTMSSGDSAYAFSAASVPFGGDCTTIRETRTCSNGVLSGSFAYETCTVGAAANCTAPWGATVNHGNSVTAYATNVHANCAGQASTRTCNNGTLSGSGNYQSCSAPANCTAPWGATVLHGNSVTAYAVTSHSNCASQSQSRTCNNGTLSGTYTNQNCSAPACTAWTYDRNCTGSSLSQYAQDNSPMTEAQCKSYCNTHAPASTCRMSYGINLGTFNSYICDCTNGAVAVGDYGDVGYSYAGTCP